MRQALRFGLFCLFLFTATGAQAADPVQFVQSLGDRAVATLKDKNLAPAQRNEKFRAMLQDSFDLQTIARFVIGRSWNTATPEQKDQYMELFEKLVVKTYADRFALYTGEGFEAKASRAEGEKDFVVNSFITHPDGSAPTQVDWRLRQRDGKLGVIDVTVEGVGMSITQRQEYGAIIQRSGGDIGPLLEEMKKRVDAK